MEDRDPRVDWDLVDVMEKFNAAGDAKISPNHADADALQVAWLSAKNPFIGGEYYRATRPAMLASSRFGWHTAVSQQVGDIEGSDRVWLATPNGHVLDPDVIVIRPISDTSESPWSMSELVDRAHKAGQMIVADLDDDVWAHEDAANWPTDDHYEEWCFKADAWLVSTPVIKERLDGFMIAAAGNRERREPVIVAPNCYDPVGLGKGPKPIAGRRLGTRLWLSGRQTDDFPIYRECFGPLLEKLDLQFVHIGKEVPTPEIPEPRSFVDTMGFPAERVLELPSLTIPELGPMLAMTTSIGAIAMADHPYNRAKTETHAIELASTGLPLVAATSLGIYKNVPGRVDPTPEAVEARVAHLLDPSAWLNESHFARGWAEGVAIRAENAYMEALSEVVTYCMKVSRRESI
jgi:hypothetical protein